MGNGTTDRDQPVIHVNAFGLAHLVIAFTLQCELSGRGEAMEGGPHNCMGEGAFTQHSGWQDSRTSTNYTGKPIQPFQSVWNNLYERYVAILGEQYT